MTKLLQWTLTLSVIAAISGAAEAQSPNDAVSPLPSPSIPAGPRPTASVTPLQTTPQPTTTVTPLPSASPSGTQPRTTNTVAPSPTATPAL